jgi:hypothetical protein
MPKEEDTRLLAAESSEEPQGTPASPLRYLPSLEYLLSCSRGTLCDLELHSLARSANHLKTAKREWEEASAQIEVAGVARWLIENRDQLLEQCSRTLAVSTTPEYPTVVAVKGPKTGLNILLSGGVSQGVYNSEPKKEKK